MEKKYNKCLMVYFEPSEQIKDIQKGIKKLDVYDEPGCGIEKETHATLLYGLSEDVTVEQLKKIVKPLNRYRTMCLGSSLFENDDFDVLKMDAHNKALVETNKELRDNFDYKGTYSEYKPHITIAYIRKGEGKKYAVPTFRKTLFLKPVKFVLSTEIEPGKYEHEDFVVDKEVVKEDCIPEVINEMAYPASFDMEEFKKCNTFAARVRYCQARLPRIASGSSRIVYKIDDEKVLKLAKNAKGIAQNKTESNSYAEEVGIGAKVFDYEESGLWLEMELARKCIPNDFKAIVGQPFKVVQNYIMYVAKQYSRNMYISYDRRYKDLFAQIDNEEIDNFEWFNMLYDYMANTGLEAYVDLTRISSWGVVKRSYGDEIVLIDFGLDDENFDQYYKRR